MPKSAQRKVPDLKVHQIVMVDDKAESLVNLWIKVGRFVLSKQLTRHCGLKQRKELSK